MAAQSIKAAESNSLQPSVPAIAAVRCMRSFAPGCEGGLPSTLITVASTTSSPRPIRWASSSSTLGMSGGAGEDGAQHIHGAGDLVVCRCVAGGEPETAQRALQIQAHREQDVRRVQRSRRTRRSAGRGDPGQVESEEYVLTPPSAESACGEVRQPVLVARELTAQLEQ